MKVLSKIVTIISILFLLWFAISTIEVVSKNTIPNPKYSSTNMWIMFAELGADYHDIEWEAPINE